MLAIPCGTCPPPSHFRRVATHPEFNLIGPEGLAVAGLTLCGEAQRHYNPVLGPESQAVRKIR